MEVPDNFDGSVPNRDDLRGASFIIRNANGALVTSYGIRLFEITILMTELHVVWKVLIYATE